MFRRRQFTFFSGCRQSDKLPSKALRREIKHTVAGTTNQELGILRTRLYLTPAAGMRQPASPTDLRTARPCSPDRLNSAKLTGRDETIYNDTADQLYLAFSTATAISRQRR